MSEILVCNIHSKNGKRLQKYWYNNRYFGDVIKRKSNVKIHFNNMMWVHEMYLSQFLEAKWLPFENTLTSFLAIKGEGFLRIWETVSFQIRTLRELSIYKTLDVSAIVIWDWNLVC
jgi:hypothetical protein